MTMPARYGWGWLAITAAIVVGCTAETMNQNDPHAAVAERWTAGDAAVAGAVHVLTSEERDVVAHINLARANPAAYAHTFLRPRRALFTDKVYFDPLDPSGRGLRTLEGVAVVDEAAQELDATPPMPPLSVSPALTRAARKHAADQAETGETGHGGRDGSTPASRVDDQGHWNWLVGEVAAYGPTNAREIVSRLLIDDGVASRGHRRNMLNSSFGAIGVAIENHPRFGRAVVVDFADYVTE